MTLVVPSSESKAITLQRFAPIAKNDCLHFSGVTNQTIWIDSIDEPGVQLPIVPVFKVSRSFRLGSLSTVLTISEIETKEQYNGYLSLERFHYRSNPSLIQQDEQTQGAASGRRAVLLASMQIGKVEKYVGYIELSMPLMMVAPRRKAFDRPFEHSRRPVNWSRWDQHALRKYLNLIVRIARVVTHPTFRGVGLSHTLLAEAEKFAKERWHIGNRRPLFMEISAEMLNYFDFVSGCGFVYCGHTEGNQARVAKDMRQMARGQKINSGIMTLQNKYFNALSAYAEYAGIDMDDAIRTIGRIAESKSPEECVDEQTWVLLRKIFRQPRPYFIKGLDHEAVRYLAGFAKPKIDSEPIRTRIRAPRVYIKDLVVSAAVSLPQSKNVKVVKDAFGLEGIEIQQNLLRLDEFRATQGEVFLIAGASGTGKSVFLDVLGKNESPLRRNLSVSFQTFEIGATAKFAKIDPEVIVVDYFSEKYGLRVSLKMLAIVGLSEAIPLIKPFWMLSKGQKYRVLLADLILRDAEVWLLDEFGSDLDQITATVVASKLRKLADRYGAIAVVAAANNLHFYKALRPSKVLNFDMGAQPEIKNMLGYQNELF